MKSKKSGLIAIEILFITLVVGVIGFGHHKYTKGEWGSAPTKHLDQEVTGNGGNFTGGFMNPTEVEIEGIAIR